MRISEPAVQAKSVATPYEAQFEQLGGETTDRTIILSQSECREVATIDRMYTNGERDLAKEAATAASIVRACNAHDDLVNALQGVIRVADRDTDEFNAARAALAKATATE